MLFFFFKQNTAYEVRISDWSSDVCSSDLGDSQGVEIEAGAELAPFLAPKGSIAVDGVSLTVNTLDDLPGGGVRFGINVIPHTAQVTSFGTLEPGREVNQIGRASIRERVCRYG